MAVAKAIDKQTVSPSNYQAAPLNNASSIKKNSSIKQKISEQQTTATAVEATDIFADMLADLADEVLNQHE